jgi:hypothetical protein
MWRTRKWAEGRSVLRMCRVASSVGWREREEMCAVREGSCALAGGLLREVVWRREVARGVKGRFDGSVVLEDEVEVAWEWAVAPRVLKAVVAIIGGCGCVVFVDVEPLANEVLRWVCEITSMSLQLELQPRKCILIYIHA